MKEHVRLAFECRIVTLPVISLLPRRQITEAIRKSTKYKRILSSVGEVGIVEPLVVARLDKRESSYLLLDGHLRLSALLDTGATEARCLISDDDEAFTYNKRVNRLATIQEHFMIMRALESGVSEEKLAKALDVDTKLIRRRRQILDGICPEVVDLLKDKSVNPQTFDTLRKMKPLRQIEVAELMCITGNWTCSYAKALLAATRQVDLIKPEKPKKIAGLTAEQMARMEREMASLSQDFKQVEASYGDDVLHLVIASGYLSKLLANAEIERYLATHHAEIAEEFRSIISAASLDHAQSAAA